MQRGDFEYSKTECLRKDSEFAFWRIHLRDGASALLLQPMKYLPQESIERLEHEFSLRSECAASSAVTPLAIVQENDRPSLLFADPGGVLLENLIVQEPAGMAIDDFFSLAIALCNALVRLHATGLIHKDIRPSNFLVDIPTKTIHITGLGHAERARHHRLLSNSPEPSAGSLAYMSPEQTKHMNRSVDSRSDLYSLGIIFYQMLTGRLPFSAEDAMGWIHCHVAKIAQPPKNLRTEIPLQLSALVMKLLAKEAEQRYQTANGLLIDLQRCRDEWSDTGEISNFLLGVCDNSEQLLLPEKLYGRNVELGCLEDCFRRVTSTGANELVLVTGYSGIGKSSLIGELHKIVASPQTFFGTGKFDQYKRDIPYAAISDIFTGLVRQILTGSDEDLALWKQKIVKAAGVNGQLLVDLIPDLVRIIGKQPEVSLLDPAEAQKRLFNVLASFIGLFAHQGQPLVLFLDDLQWLDNGSLKLLEFLATQRELKHLMLIGGYRDNEVGPSHPLALMLESIGNAGITIRKIVLKPLQVGDLVQLLADTFHGNTSETTALALIIIEKTGGNPFFSLQFLSSLHEEGLLRFETDARKWTWNIEEIRTKGFTDNVVDLMLGKLQRLPAESRNVLSVCASIGTSVQKITLAAACSQDSARLEQNLGEALRAGYLFKDGEAFRFAHDRIQEAAYLLLETAKRAQEHLRIGRLLSAAMRSGVIEKNVFDLARQYNAASGLIAANAEKSLVRKINTEAGKRAKASGAHASAQHYFCHAFALLAKNAWKSDYSATFELHVDLAESEFLIGHFDQANHLFNLALEKAHSNADRSQIYRLRILLYQVAGHYDKAVEIACNALSSFGITCPGCETEIACQVAEDHAEVLERLRGHLVADLIDAPRVSNPDKRAVLGILANAMPSAYFSRPPLYPWLILKALIQTLREGNAEESSAAYMGYAILLTCLYRDIDLAFEFSELALRLQEKFNQPLLRGRLLCRHGLFINSHRHHLTSSIAILEQAFVLCQEAGDVAYSAYSAIDIAWLTMESGSKLSRDLTVIDKYLDFAEQSHNRGLLHTLLAQKRYIRSLMAEPGRPPFEDDDETFDADLKALREANFGAGIAYFFLLKQMAAYAAGRYHEAVAFAAEVALVLPSIQGWFAEASYHYYAALSLLAASETLSPNSRAEVLEHLQELEFQSSHCEDNFSHRYRLTLAELSRVDGNAPEAMQLYESAIALAQSNAFLQDEALANELAAAFFSRRGGAKAAHAYMTDARDCYFRLGALRKVDAMDRQAPMVASAMSISRQEGIPAGQFDAMAMLKSYQAISGELVLDRLLRTLMTLLMEIAGAQRALLLLKQEHTLRVAAEASTAPTGSSVRLLKADDVPVDFPNKIINYVARTGERVLVADAQNDSAFADDPYLRATNTRSILCLPVFRQGDVIGIFYFENNLLTGAFTERHVTTLELIGLQAAVSIENAALYADLERRVAQRTEALSSEIRERQLAQDRLRQTLNELELILEHASIGIAVIVRENHIRRIHRANRAAESIFGYAHGELVGKDTRTLYLNEEDYQHLDSAYASLSLGLSFQCELQLLRKDGQSIYTHMIGVAIDPLDLSKGSIWLIEDVTARRAAQIELQATNADLSAALERLTKTQKELLRSEKLAALGALVAGVAHELNTPIGNALMVVTTLNDHAQELTNMLESGLRRATLKNLLTDLSEACLIAERNLERAANLVTSFKQIAVDQTSSKRRFFALAEIIAEIITAVAPTFKNTPFSITSEIAPGIEMDSYPGPLGQVILNLITNAIFHGLSGLPRGQVRITAAQISPDQIELRVSDDGHGIPAKFQNRVFDPFFTTHLGQGTSGLGLSIVHNIVTEILGGTINFSSEVDQGTIFILQIPNSAPELIV